MGLPAASAQVGPSLASTPSCSMIEWRPLCRVCLSPSGEGGQERVAGGWDSQTAAALPHHEGESHLHVVHCRVVARRSCRSKCVATAVHGQQHEAAVVHTHRFPSYAIALDLTAPAYTAVKASHLQRRWHSNQSRPLTRPSGPTRTMCIRNCLMVLPAGKDCVPMRAPARAWPPLSPARRRRVRGSPASFVRKRTDMRMEAGLHQAERGGRRVGPRGSWLLASRQ